MHVIFSSLPLGQGTSSNPNSIVVGLPSELPPTILRNLESKASQAASSFARLARSSQDDDAGGFDSESPLFVGS